MQHPLPRLLILGIVLAAGPAMAQVKVDPRALDPLAPPPLAPPPLAPPSTEKSPAKPPARPARPPAKPQAAVPPPPPPPPVARPEPPVIPPAAPTPPVIPPPIAVPARPPIAPGAVAVAPDAPGTVTPIPGGIRATFGAGRADLNPDSEKAVRAFARAMPAGATMTVIATAAGAPEDPSTPRRLALSRGLAMRSLAITEGIASTRVVVRALGASPIAGIPGAIDGPPDRADLTLTLPPPPAAPPK